jgi:hypothetical protein
MVTTSVGAQPVTEVPTDLPAENAVTVLDSGTRCAAVGWPGLRTPPPDVTVAVPDQCAMLPFAMVSAAEPPPVVKFVADTVAVHPATPGRQSVTVTVPIEALIVPPGTALPRLAVSGTVIVVGAG